MDTEVGPDGLPAVFDGGTWFSQDRRYQWDGTAWVKSSRSPEGLSLTHVCFAVVFVAVIGYAVYTMVSTESAFAIASTWGRLPSSASFSSFFSSPDAGVGREA